MTSRCPDDRRCPGARGPRPRASLAVVPEQPSRQQLKLGNRNLNLNVIGTTPQHAEVNGVTTFQAGRLLAREEDGRARRSVSAVIGGEVALSSSGQPAADLVGRTLLIKADAVRDRRRLCDEGPAVVLRATPDEPTSTFRSRHRGLPRSPGDRPRSRPIAVEVARGTEARAGDGHRRARPCDGFTRLPPGRRQRLRRSCDRKRVSSPRSKRRRRSWALCSPASPVSACSSVASAS